MNETLTDIQGLVDGAFKEVQCEIEATTVPHGGDIAALRVSHNCCQQLMCAGHLKYFLEVSRPQREAQIAQRGFYICTWCQQRFFTIDEFMKVYVL